ncbi:phosphotransferase [Aphanothece sacrum]|uniref:Aminoglycoside phosphotransferase n=1 Tax=Aphanothece sacrum FPU1 TaxID=1920663 RepID=A0A401IH75_APHSA|nr:phosphotransferase [Aphanothece sacrum]GBF80647.1 aminoglycoside phosphotransferase [Aphanothece sacrum FPU1]GBF83141.1 aminoglycoside phosphotransferase [Aphanothece sacrum FPU3]
MKFLLNSSNIFDYLSQLGLLNLIEQPLCKIELIEAKNFNLLVTLPNSSQLLVKQERMQKQEKVIGEFYGEWRIQNLINQFPELADLQTFLPEMLHFDRDNYILVFSYLQDYQDLSKFYQKEKIFPPLIAAAIGKALGTIHRDTFNHQVYQNFLAENQENLANYHVTHLIQGLERLTPEIFATVPNDGLKFFLLYQRYDSLGQSLAELGQAFNPACLTHNDLKLNNILLNNDWESSTDNLVRFIDLERASWGDPAYDLGMLLGSYLQLWLSNLIINKSLTIEESLRLAVIPLEKIQPSIAALTQAYLRVFPDILSERPDFLERVIQFIGLALIQQIQAMIQYQKVFGNMGIVMLQVAKKLLGYPHQSMATIFGTTEIYSTSA